MYVSYVGGGDVNRYNPSRKQFSNMDQKALNLYTL